MTLLRAGVGRTVIALWLGHESAETAQIYLHADMRLKEQALWYTDPSGITPARFRPKGGLLPNGKLRLFANYYPGIAYFDRISP